MVKKLTIFIAILFASTCIAGNMTYIKPNLGYEKCPTTASTKLLIHSNTTNGSVVFTDSSGQGQTITTSDAGGGDVKHSTDYAKFGTTSILCSNDEHLVVTDSQDFRIGSNDATIDFWLYDPSASGQTECVFSQKIDADNYILVYYVSADLEIQFYIKTATAEKINILTGDGTMVVGKWNHVAIVKTGNNYFSYINGKFLVSDSDATAVPNYTSNIYVGNSTINSTLGMVDTYIDEFRFTNGEALWKGDFIPPRAPAY